MNLVHGASLVNFFNMSDEVILDTFVENSDWTRLKTEIFSRKKTYDFSGPDYIYPQIGFSVTLERIPTFIMYDIIYPVMLLTFLSCLVFVLPAEAGEKVGLQITILLAFYLMLLVMRDTTPKSGKTTPLISTPLTVHIYCTVSQKFIRNVPTGSTFLLCHCPFCLQLLSSCSSWLWSHRPWPSRYGYWACFTIQTTSQFLSGSNGLFWGGLPHWFAWSVGGRNAKRLRGKPINLTK